MKLSDFYGSYSEIFDKMNINVRNRFERDYIRKSDGALKYPPDVICRFILDEFCSEKRFRVIFDGYEPGMKLAIISGYRTDPNKFIDKLLVDLAPQLYNDEGMIFDQAYDDSKIDELHGPDGYTDHAPLATVAQHIIHELGKAGADNIYISDEGDSINFHDRNGIGVIDAAGPEIIKIIEGQGWDSSDFVFRDSIIYFPAGELVKDESTGTVEIVNDDNLYQVGDKFLNTSNGITLEIKQYLGSGVYGMGTVGEEDNIKTYSRVDEVEITVGLKRGLYEEVDEDTTDLDPYAISARDGTAFLGGPPDVEETENGEIVLQTEKYTMHLWADKKNGKNKREKHWAVELRNEANEYQYGGEVIAFYNGGVDDFEFEELVIDGEDIDQIFDDWEKVTEDIAMALGL